MDAQAFGAAKGYADRLVGFAARPALVPSAISSGWGLTTWAPSTVNLYDDPIAPYGSIGITPEALFDKFSTARSAPGVTYYVNFSTGSDANNGLTSGAALKSIGKATALANAGGVPALVYVAAGSYARTWNPNNGFSGQTVDMAFVATGGRVITGTWDDFTAPSVDGTFTNCYSYAVTNVDRVVDRLNLNQYGNYVEFLNVPTAARCNATPNSWSLVSGTVYINRADGAAVTIANTRVYRGTSRIWQLNGATQTSLYLGGQTDADGFDLEGGSTNGALDVLFTGKPASEKAIIAKNCSFKYAGGISGTAARCVSVDSLHGLAAFFNCRADASQTDAFNFHDSQSISAVSRAITVNCSGYDMGRAGQTSCNGWTNHEDHIGIDVAGVYRDGQGGLCRSVNSSKAWFVGTVCRNDKGDLQVSGGTVYPAAFNTQDTAAYYLDGCHIDMPAAAYSLYTMSAGASIFYRNMKPFRQPVGGAGTASVW